MTPAVTASTHAPTRRSLRSSSVGRRRFGVRSAALVRLASTGPSGFELYDAACQGCRGVVLPHATAPAPPRVSAARALTSGAYAPSVLQEPHRARHRSGRPALSLPQELSEGHAKPRRHDGHYATRFHDAVLTAERADRRARQRVYRPAHTWHQYKGDK
jgi:hypothetical protein